MNPEKETRIKEILDLESKAILNLPITDEILTTVEKICNCKGKVILSGIGKAGIVAQKISSSFSSTGTPSIFLHPTEAQHGDLGILSNNDILILISNSGKTREVIELVELSKKLFPKDNLTTISITSDLESELAKSSDISLTIGKVKEACPIQMAPTSSTTAMMALGDILVILSMEEKKFTKDDFLKRHHGGYLGTMK